MNRFGEQTAPYGAVAAPIDAPLPAVSGVSWGAIFAGAAAAAALSLILLMLGTGLGLSVVSPWVNDGVSADGLGISTILWLTITQIFASGLGGYLAGRLRAKWVDVQNDEIFFRDTAHGFLAWSVASIATAALLTTTVAAVVGSGVQAGAALAGGTAAAVTAGAVGASARRGSGEMARADNNSVAYFVDALFRKELTGNSPVAMPGGTAPAADGAVASAPPPANGDADSPQATAEVVRIFLAALHAGALPPEDLHYVSQIVASRAALSPADAEKRVSETFARLRAKLIASENAAREAADQVRKASAHAALWLFVSLLIGAFIASLAATFGGRQRDI